MGKETKIGVAVIVVLMLAFSVVLGMRLKGSSNDLSTAQNVGKPKADAKDLTSQFAKSTKPKFAASKSSKPTIVSAKANSGRAPVLTADSKTNRWSFASDAKKSAAKKTTRSQDTSPPSFMPKPPRASSTDRYGSPIPTQSTRASRVQSWLNKHSRKPTDTDPFSRQTKSIAAPVAKTPTTFLPARPNPALGASPLQTGPLVQNPSHGRYPSANYKNTTYGRTNTHQYQRSPARMPSSRHTVSLNRPQYQTRQATRNEDGSYTIQPNDSYWTISQSLYGHGGYFKALAEYNAGKFPDADKLRVGDQIDAPDREELEKKFANLCPRPEHRDAARLRASNFSNVSQFGSGGRTYVVEPGDTLYDIAKYELGNAARWVEIYELNKDRLGKDFDYLTNGMKLTLPDNDSSGTVTQRRSTSVYQR